MFSEVSNQLIKGCTQNALQENKEAMHYVGNSLHAGWELLRINLNQKHPGCKKGAAKNLKRPG